MYRTILIALGASILLLGSTAQAQVGSPRASRYAPTRPAISPWLSLSRGNTGGIPSYQAWVQPQFELMRRQNFVDQQFGNVNQQFGNVRQEFSNVEGQLMRPPTAIGSAPAQAPQFMNYGSFYTQPSGLNVRQR